MANVYGYRVGIQNDPDDYYVDRGYVFADNQRSAVDKIFNEFKNEEVYHFEIFEFGLSDFNSNKNDVYSVYTLLSEFGIGKAELVDELKNWSLI